MVKSYCTQNNGDCATCSLTNYGLDCANNPVNATPVPSQEEFPITVSKDVMRHLREKEETAWWKLVDLLSIYDLYITVNDNPKKKSVTIIWQKAAGMEPLRETFPYSQVLEKRQGRLVTDGIATCWIIIMDGQEKTVITDLFQYLYKRLLAVALGVIGAVDDKLNHIV